jgi:hypothetical protein
MNSGHGGGGMGGYSGTTQQIEGQNDDRLSGLLGKVKSLKDVRQTSSPPCHPDMLSAML